MRRLFVLLGCVAVAGCSRATIGALPAAERSGTSAAPQSSYAGIAFRLLYRFKGTPDGALPAGRLLDVDGTLYGTTVYGGAMNDGTVFRIAPSGAETELYSFAGGSDGKWPAAGLIDVNGILYGTTVDGGASGKGTVFKITLSGKERVIHSFQGGQDGENPYARLIEEVVPISGGDI